MRAKNHTGLLREFAQSSAGSIMPIMMICLTSIMALMAASIALSMDSRSANNLQVTADAAALGGATAFLNATSPKLEDRLAEANAQAASLASANTEYVLTDLAVGAASEDAYGQKIQLAVELEFKPVNVAAGLAGRNANVDIRRRAVAEATWGFPLCVLTLATSGPGLSVNDNTTLLAKNCVIWSNSTSDDSMSFTGGSATTKHFCTAGQAEISNAASVTPKPSESCQALPDPLAGYDVASSTACDYMKFKVQRNRTIYVKPGTYCGGMEIKSDDVDFAPGIYHILDGPLRFHVKGDIEAEGVTFLLDGEIKDFEVKSESSVTLIAPDTGPTAGVAIAQRASMQTGGNGNSALLARIIGTLNVEGVIYMPSFDLTLSKSGGGATKSPYLQLIANRLIMDGNASLLVDFDESATSLPIVIEAERFARLVE